MKEYSRGSIDVDCMNIHPFQLAEETSRRCRSGNGCNHRAI
jgi:hypothetical protein